MRQFTNGKVGPLRGSVEVFDWAPEGGHKEDPLRCESYPCGMTFINTRPYAKTDCSSIDMFFNTYLFYNANITYINLGTRN